MSRVIEYDYKKEIMLWWSAILIGLMDILSTWFGLNSGYTEKNPVGQILIGELGFYYLIILKLVIVILCATISKIALDKFVERKWRYMPPTILSVVWMIAFSINTVTIL